ncbi:hypothetical protein BpHYR1_031429 [Brachionus plicatilis]|uniref:Uncharacterized protein n=1 Tax=Brachionus plicatilis TaxID=10195 RepID=A0A3M7RB44_BRAPC|nr:hypothetical protein BpHYR1_031429 [Brachionus plicatilis]
MDFLHEIFKNLTPMPNLTASTSIVEKLNINLDQAACDKQKLENLIDQQRKHLIKLEELLDLVSKSEETLLKIKKNFKCQKCSGDLGEKKFDQEFKSKLGNQKMPTNKTESQTFGRLQKILNDCTQKKPENSAKKYQYSIENKGIQIHRSKPHPQLESFDFTKFSLVKLHMNEAPVGDFNSIKEWTLIKTIKRNTSLESKMAKRNESKLNQLKQTVKPEELSRLTKRNLVSDMHSMMNYDFCNNRYGFKEKKPRKPKKKIETNKTCVDKNDDLMMELYGFETENKENETRIDADDLYDDLNENPVIDLNEFDLKNDDDGEKIAEKKATQIDSKEIQKILSPKKEFKNLDMTKTVKQDAYSRRKSDDRHLTKSSIRRPRSGSKSRKRSRSPSFSRSNSKRRELNKSHDDRKKSMLNSKFLSSRIQSKKHFETDKQINKIYFPTFKSLFKTLIKEFYYFFFYFQNPFEIIKIYVLNTDTIQRDEIAK